MSHLPLGILIREEGFLKSSVSVLGGISWYTKAGLSNSFIVKWSDYVLFLLLFFLIESPE